MILTIISCSSPDGKQIPDVSHIPMDSIKIQRFDQSLDSLSADRAAGLHRQWKETYGQFYTDYIEKILKVGPVDDDAYIPVMLGEIASLPAFRSLNDSVAQTFPDLHQQEGELTDAFRRVRYHLPDAEIPAHFIAYYSGFSVQVPVGEDYIGIGLDLFLGSESAFYPELIDTFPLYLSRRFTPRHISPRIVEAYIREYLLPTEPHGGSFLDHMLYEGRSLYLMDQLLPFTPDSLKIGYSKRQNAWARHFQKEIWDWIIEEELLYDTDPSTIRSHFGEAPFTVGLGEQHESAPKLGAYTGWQMIRSYMDLHPETHLKELLSFTDAQAFLAASGYQGDYSMQP